MLSLESYRTARWVRTINLVLQGLLFLTLFGGLNYLSLYYHWRFDLSQHRRYSLSPETLSYLHDLSRPVRIVVTLTPDSDNPDAAQAYHDARRNAASTTKSVLASTPSGTRISAPAVSISIISPRDTDPGAVLPMAASSMAVSLALAIVTGINSGASVVAASSAWALARLRQ